MVLCWCRDMRWFWTVPSLRGCFLWACVQRCLCRMWRWFWGMTFVVVVWGLLLPGTGGGVPATRCGGWQLAVGRFPCLRRYVCAKYSFLCALGRRDEVASGIRYAAWSAPTCDLGWVGFGLKSWHLRSVAQGNFLMCGRCYRRTGVSGCGPSGFMHCSFKGSSWWIWTLDRTRVWSLLRWWVSHLSIWLLIVLGRYLGL